VIIIHKSWYVEAAVFEAGEQKYSTRYSMRSKSTVTESHGRRIHEYTVDKNLFWGELKMEVVGDTPIEQLSPHLSEDEEEC
jgi:hypothetical protein